MKIRRLLALTLSIAVLLTLTFGSTSCKKSGKFFGNDKESAEYDDDDDDYDDDDDDDFVPRENHYSVEPAEAVEAVVEYQPTMQEVAATGDADYAYMVSDTWLEPSMLKGFSKQELRRMRNTIYAIHGRFFRDPELQKYFYQFSWYAPYRYDIPNNELSETERHNITVIQSCE